jgi:hypothetical protein
LSAYLERRLEGVEAALVQTEAKRERERERNAREKRRSEGKGWSEERLCMGMVRKDGRDRCKRR